MFWSASVIWVKEQLNLKTTECYCIEPLRKYLRRFSIEQTIAGNNTNIVCLNVVWSCSAVYNSISRKIYFDILLAYCRENDINIFYNPNITFFFTNERKTILKKFFFVSHFDLILIFKFLITGTRLVNILAYLAKTMVLGFHAKFLTISHKHRYQL